MKYRAGQVVRAPSGGTYVPRPLSGQCRVCGANPEQTICSLFSSWLPANQHASDSRTRAVVEVTFPFEFRCYESWGIAFYIKFNEPPSPAGLETSVDALSGHRFGPFGCFCEADKAIRAYFEASTGEKSGPGQNLYRQMREIVEG